MQIIKVPGINNKGKNESCRNAGNVIISALDRIWSSEKGKPIDKNLLDFEEIHLNNNDLEEQNELIYKNSFEALEFDRVIFLGGDHSISCQIGRAFLEKCVRKGKEPCLIVFDAHSDCMPVFEHPDNESWLSSLIGQGFRAHDILIVGARNLRKEEIEFLGEHNIRQISINELTTNLEETTDLIMEFASGCDLYVSFDMDVIDPAFASGTKDLEPGGLTSRQAVYIISRIAMMKNLRAFDIVEVDANDKGTVKLAAKLLGEIL